MTTVLPIDYATILEATEMLQAAMHAGGALLSQSCPSVCVTFPPPWKAPRP